MLAEGMARFAIDNTALEIYWVDETARFVEVNQAACRALGYRRDELLTLRVHDIDPLFGSQRFQDLFRSLRIRPQQRLEGIHRRKDRSEYPVEVVLGLARLNDEELICVACLDITRWRRTLCALQEANEQYRAIIETARDGFWAVDLDGRLLEVNDVYCSQSGYSREELLKLSVADLEASEDKSEVHRHMAGMVERGGDVFESWHRRKDGELWPIEVSVSYAPVQGGRLFGFVRDISERKLQENLFDLRQKLAVILELGDMDTLMRTALDNAEKATFSEIGYFHFVESDQQNISLQVWSTRTLREMCFAEGKGLHYPVSEAGVWVDCILQRKPVIHNDYANLPHKKGLPDGHAPLIRELSVPVFRDGLIVAVIGVGNKSRDYTERDVEAAARIADIAYDFVQRMRTEQRIEYMAYYDTLTGLPNRVLLSDRLTQALAHCSRTRSTLAVCYMDLDGFKPINDSFGHDAGDSLLEQLAQRLREVLREGDTLARIGGDEFAVLLTDLANAHESEVIVQRILDAVARPFEIGGNRLEVSASMGITLFPTDGADAEVLLRHADQAMYQAKNAGKGRFRLYDMVQEQKLRAHRQILTEIDQALRRDEFVLFYQPRVDLSSGQLMGVEALVRWNHPEQGLLLPGRFLSYMEGNRRELELGEWVLNRAVRQHLQWRERGLRLPVSVNISPRQIQQQGFAGQVTKLLQAGPSDLGECLELEILETAAIGDIAHVGQTMRECIDLGVRFSLDDFGTGYSSLSYFHRLPVDILKIDQHFVRSMLDDLNDLDIVEGVLRLANTLKRPVVAEGVESLELGLMLLQMGCRYAQGYGIAKPMPADRVPHWRERWLQNNVWQHLHQEVERLGYEVELQVAIFAHRRWLQMLAAYLERRPEASLPPMGERQCQFSRWYNGIGRARYGGRPLYAFIPPKHNRLHKIAEHLIELCDQGRRDEALAGLATLRVAGEELLAMLERLADE